MECTLLSILLLQEPEQNHHLLFMGRNQAPGKCSTKRPLIRHKNCQPGTVDSRL